jgi:hypothetical protein
MFGLPETLINIIYDYAGYTDFWKRRLTNDVLYHIDKGIVLVPIVNSISGYFFKMLYDSYYEAPCDYILMTFESFKKRCIKCNFRIHVPNNATEFKRHYRITKGFNFVLFHLKQKIKKIH